MAESIETEKSRLRPAQEIIDRITWDPSFNISHYRIGYWDRVLQKIKGKFLCDWHNDPTHKDFIAQHRIQYIWRWNDGSIVWHRARRIDKISSGTDKYRHKDDMIVIADVAMSIDSEHKQLQGSTSAATVINHLLFKSQDPPWSDVLLYFDREDDSTSEDEEDVGRIALGNWRFINGFDDGLCDFRSFRRADLTARRAGQISTGDEDDNIDARSDTIPYSQIRFISTHDGAFIWRRADIFPAQDSSSRDSTSLSTSDAHATPHHVLEYFRIAQLLSSSSNALCRTSDYDVTLANAPASTDRTPHSSNIVELSYFTGDDRSRRDERESLGWEKLTRRTDGKVVWSSDGVDLIFGSGKSILSP